MITAKQIREWDAEGKIYKFYKSKEWLAIRDQIMRECHGECQWCKRRGIISRAETVHHEQYVRSHPEFALSRTYTDRNGVERQNLIPLCHDCHDKAHDRMRHQKKKPALNEERW